MPQRQSRQVPVLPVRQFSMRPATRGERVAESVARVIGSWWWVTGQTLVIVVWIVLHVLQIFVWDPWPFIALNLVLALPGAYALPILLMAANRQERIDRAVLYGDYEVGQRLDERLTRLIELLEKVEGIEKEDDL